MGTPFVARTGYPAGNMAFIPSAYLQRFIGPAGDQRAGWVNRHQLVPAGGRFQAVVTAVGGGIPEYDESKRLFL